jgi:aminobenzoyl-glutamate utilization protein B
MQSKQDVIQWLEDSKDQFIAMSDDIWAKPELSWEEYFASALQADFLHDKGFKVYSIADMPTAFIAEWGTGAPIIGFAGEYDALPGLSQKVQTTQEPIEEGAAGHGCGHNMLGTAAVASVVALKEWLQATGRPGTVRYYGCPAEEGGSAKAYMARAGVFDDCAVAFNFHPASLNMATKGSCVAIVDAKFEFHGRTSHAGGSPHLGRSALDAVELMNVGVNYLREHVKPDVRMHYVIRKGGEAPNIVPDLAEVWYFLRAPQADQLEDVVRRVKLVADGAAMMTETQVKPTISGGCANVLSNYYLADLQYAAMQEVGPIDFNAEEIAFAQAINDNFPAEMFEGAVSYLTTQYKMPEDIVRQPLISQNSPPSDEGLIEGGSTDVGDMSWCVPMSMLITSCVPTASPGHSWGDVAAGGMSIGHKGMMHAAKIMAVAAMDCFTDPVHIQKAREEFEKVTDKQPYKTLLHKDAVKPPVEFNPPENHLVERYPQYPDYTPGKH